MAGIHRRNGTELLTEAARVLNFTERAFHSSLSPAHGKDPDIWRKITTLKLPPWRLPAAPSIF
jgi:hypothetical protein